MGRFSNEWGHIRTVKPTLFDHEELYEAEETTGLPLRLVFVGMFCQADRSGRFKWRPRRLKCRVLPYDDVDFSACLDALVKYGFLVRYDCDGATFGAFPSWDAHQFINGREAESGLPPPPGCEESRGPPVGDASATRDDATTETVATRDDAGAKERNGTERIGTERKGKDWKGRTGNDHKTNEGGTFVALANKLHPKELTDRHLVARVAEIVDAGEISEHDAHDAAEGAIRTKNVKNPMAYFLTILRENVGREKLDDLLKIRREK